MIIKPMKFYFLEDIQMHNAGAVLGKDDMHVIRKNQPLLYDQDHHLTSSVKKYSSVLKSNTEDAVVLSARAITVSHANGI